MPVDVPRESITPPKGAIAVFPVRSDGTEMNWEYTDAAFDKWWKEGYIRANGKKMSLSLTLSNIFLIRRVMKSRMELQSLSINVLMDPLLQNM